MTDHAILFENNDAVTLPIKDGRSVCASGDFIVVPEIRKNRVSVYGISSLALVTRFGYNKYGQPAQPSVGVGVRDDNTAFHFDGWISGVCAGVGTLTNSPTVFVTDMGKARVGEYELPAGNCLRILGTRFLSGPVGVHANDTHIAVSDCDYGDADDVWAYEISSIVLFHAAATADDRPLRTFHIANVIGALNSPRGLRLSRDGTAIFVADTHSNRVLRISITCDQVVSSTTVLASRERHGLCHPHDVLECDDGWVLVADCRNHRLVAVSSLSPGRAAVSSSDSDPLQFYAPSGLAYDARIGLIVCDGRPQERRLQLFYTLWSGLRRDWIALVARTQEAK